LKVCSNREFDPFGVDLFTVVRSSSSIRSDSSARARRKTTSYSLLGAVYLVVT
jgi:hypothetical protein